MSPAFIAARAGYDVWLGNSRGNSFSLGHTDGLDPWSEGENSTAKAYWNFTFTEMGLYDLPATIDYILAKTGWDKIAYIGHSMGTTQMFVGLAEMPEYFNDKIAIFIALSPVTKVPDIYLLGFREFMVSHFDYLDESADYYDIEALMHFNLEDGKDDSMELQHLCLLLPETCLYSFQLMASNKTVYDDPVVFQRFI